MSECSFCCSGIGLCTVLGLDCRSDVMIIILVIIMMIYNWCCNTAMQVTTSQLTTEHGHRVWGMEIIFL